MRTSFVPDFHRQVLAVQHVEELLKRATAALESAHIDYAIIGGNAVAAWVATVEEGAVRATKDVDIMLRRGDLALATSALRLVNLDLHEVNGIRMFLDRDTPNPKTGVHVLFANELIRAHDKYAAPDVTNAIRSPSGYRVLDLPSLLMLKLMAFRNVDKTHIEDLLQLGLVSEQVAAQLPEDLKQRLEQIRREIRPALGE